MSTCRWCTPRDQTTVQFLLQYCSGELSSQEVKAANEDLCYCLECVVEYHQARDEVHAKHKALYKLETRRLTDHFENALKDALEDDELFLIEGEQEIQLSGYTGPDLENNLRVPILEILKYPYLLLDEGLSQLCIEALAKMEKSNFSFQAFDKHPGIYLLLVHPNETVRKWAILTARSLGKVERDDFYDLQEVITCLLKVIELDLFENSDIYNSVETETNQLILLPPHLYDITNHKNYWLGICMLFMVLDEQAMDSLLLAQDKQNDFMNSILNTMKKSEDDYASDPFWPALQCFMVILDRLGSKVWGQLIDPMEAFQTITGSHSYNKEIENIRNNMSSKRITSVCEDDDDDDLVSCSQIVYDYNTKRQNKDTGWKNAICPDYYPNMYDEMQTLVHVLQCDIGQDMRVHNSTFLWFIPFINSVMDLKNLGVVYIGEVVHHIHSEIKDVLNRKVNSCDKVAGFFILIMVCIVELHRNKKNLHLLWYSSQKWVDLLVKCANLPARVFDQHKEKAGMLGNSRITSTSLVTKSSGPCSSITSSVQQACVQLVRSFLKEGCQSQQRGTSQQFLDKLNLQLRNTFILGWQLSNREQQELKTCLIEIVKGAKDRVTEVKQSSSVGRRDIPLCPLIKQEKVEPWEWGKMVGYCKSDPEPPAHAVSQSTTFQSNGVQEKPLNSRSIEDLCEFPGSSELSVDPVKSPTLLCDSSTLPQETSPAEVGFDIVTDDELCEMFKEVSDPVRKISPEDSKCKWAADRMDSPKCGSGPISHQKDDGQIKPLHPIDSTDHRQTGPMVPVQDPMRGSTWYLSTKIKDEQIGVEVPTLFNSTEVVPQSPNKTDLPYPKPEKNNRFKFDQTRLLYLNIKMKAVNHERKIGKEEANSPPKESTDTDFANSRVGHGQSGDALSDWDSNPKPKALIQGGDCTRDTSMPHRHEPPNSDGPLSSKDATDPDSPKTPCVSPKPDQCSCSWSDADDDSDVPFDTLRNKLKKRNNDKVCLLTNSEIDRDLNQLALAAASTKSANFSAGLTQESCVMQLPETIERKIKGWVQKREIPKSSSFVNDLTTNEKGRKMVTNSHSPKRKSSTVKLEAYDPEDPDGIIGDSIPGSASSEGNKASNQSTADTTSTKNVSHLKERVSFNRSPIVIETDDSQFFEFETEEEIYSVWETTQPQEVQATVAKETVVEPSDNAHHQLGYIDAEMDMLNEWGYDTDYASDELIEKVTSMAELHLAKARPTLKLSNSSPGSTTDEEDLDTPHVNKGKASLAVSSFYSASDLLKGKRLEKDISTRLPDGKRFLLPGKKKQKPVSASRGAAESQLAKKLSVKKAMGEDTKFDTFIAPLPKVKEKCSLQGKARGKATQVSPRKGLSKFNSSKKRTNSSACFRKSSGEVYPSTNARQSSLEKKDSGKSVTTGFKCPFKDLQIDKPSDKPPLSLQQKKVRKRPEPTSLVEKLGLKKKTRKAIDLSQGSLDSLNELRNYGQARGTIEHSRSKKTKLISPQKLTNYKDPRLLVSQDLQYLRQIKHLSKQKKRKEKKKDTVSHNRSSQLLPTEEARCGSSSSITRMSGNHSGHFTSREKHINPTVANTASVKVQQGRKVDSACTKEPTLHIIGVEDNDHCDFNLTQRDPVDMDLDDEQRDDIDEFNLTQRDPVDMDLDSQEEEVDHGNSKEEAGCQHSELANVSVNAETLEKKKSPLPEQKPDVVFAKPALPPLLSKSSRPSTSKRFASSTTSRNAQLANELDILPKHPISKVKQAGQLPLLKLTESKPLVSKPAPTTNILRALNKVVNATPVANPPAAPTGTPPSSIAQPYTRFKPMQDPLRIKVDLADRQNRDASYLIKDILKWTYQMFDSLSQFGPPDPLCEFPPREVPQRFNSYEEYFCVFYPLLMLNTFEQLAKEWTESRQSHRLIQNSLTLKNHWVQEQVYHAEFQVLLHDTDLHDKQPKDGDVVFLWLPENHIPYLQEEIVDGVLEGHLGHISRASYSSDGRGSRTTLHLSVQTRGNVSAVKGQPIRCEVIGSLVNTIRQFKALLFLHKTPLALPIISISSPFFTQRDLVDGAKWSSANEYNEFQQRAINTAYAMVKQNSRIPKICLIQGPPGTGKSKTIVGFLHRLLDEEQENVAPAMSRNPRTKRTRILVCAPSNAAIDDLMKKIIVDFKSKSKDKNNYLGNCGDVNLVRLGAEKAISPDVVKFSLDCQVNYKIKKNQPDVDQQVQWRKQYLDKQLDDLGRQCAIMKKNSEQIAKLIKERRKLEMERQYLGRNQKEYRRRMQDVQLDTILGSHIICCTLSTSGAGLLEMAFRKLGHEPFSCVIVDEAGQSCESEMLIPLVYRCPKLILLGDPEQLPPTIISMKARGFGYGRSMMERLQTGLCDDVKQSGVRQQPHVLELLTQYRMHPDICLFPSRHIYGSKLKTAKAVEMQRCSPSWPFESYMLFDVTDGCEIREKGNRQEVKLVIALITLIAEKQKGRCSNIAVITPYNAQKQEIQKQIEQACRKGLDQDRTVQVGTVDGFQGCEKDCIIVTCVRANNQQANIGFLDDRQRLNVTITRARFSLFILGHLKTLMDSKDWNALIQDAQRRGAIVKTCESDYQKDCRKIMKPRPAFQRALSAQGTGDRNPELMRRVSLPESHVSDQRVGQMPKPPAPSLPAAADRPRDPRLARVLGALTKAVEPKPKDTSIWRPNSQGGHMAPASRGQSVPRPSLPEASRQDSRGETSSTPTPWSCASVFSKDQDCRDRRQHSHSDRPHTHLQEAKRRRDERSVEEQGHGKMKRRRK